jgi:hypothetical protein
VGGVGNSLERNYHYSIENDFNFIAERPSNTGVGSVNVFERYHKLWINGRVMSMTLRLDRALLRHDISHTGVTDTSSIIREDYTTHGLHLNSRCMRRLMQLTAESCWWSCIPVITHVKASPFLA